LLAIIGHDIMKKYQEAVDPSKERASVRCSQFEFRKTETGLFRQCLHDVSLIVPQISNRVIEN
jgi:hypothetical protein